MSNENEDDIGAWLMQLNKANLQTQNRIALVLTQQEQIIRLLTPSKNSEEEVSLKTLLEKLVDVVLQLKGTTEKLEKNVLALSQKKRP